LLKTLQKRYLFTDYNSFSNINETVMSRLLSSDALQTMITLADEGSFQRAAEKRNLTQAAISQQVRKLEEQLDQAVFRKAGRRMVLTEAGQLLVEHARKIVAAQQDALLALNGHNAEGAIRVGVPQDYAEDMLPNVLRRFAKRYPRMRLEVRVDKNQTLLQETRDGKRLDIVLLITEPDKLDQRPLSKPSVDWLASEDFAWTDGPVPLVLLDAPCMFRARALDALQRAGTPHRVAYSTGSLSGARAAVAAGLGIMARIHTTRDKQLGIVNVRTTRTDIARKLPKFERLAATVWHRADLTPPAQELADILRNAVAGDW
jgi:DNA-binding transcriptional LysR family regulator